MMKKIGFIFSLFLFLLACKIPYNKKDVYTDKALLTVDEAPHVKNSLEWWYFTGHLTDTVQQRHFGVEYVVFHFNPTKFKGAWMVNMAVTDADKKKFYYDHKIMPKRKRQFHDLPLQLNWDKRRISSRFSGEAGNYSISANMNKQGVNFNLLTEASKGAVLHDGVGYEDYGEVARAGYYSFPRLATQGEIRIKDKTYNVRGNLWYDRQWNCSGVFNPGIAWDWFAVQFEETQSELMIYRVYKKDDSLTIYGGTYTDKDGTSTYLENEQIQLTELEQWKSPESGFTYPIKWQIEVEDLALNTTIEPVIQQQELRLKSTPVSNFYYWEGMCYAKGKIGGEKVHGNSYVEMNNRK